MIKKNCSNLETSKFNKINTISLILVDRRFSPPMFLHTSTQSDLLADLCADRVGEDDLGQISLDGADAAACRQRADVHHQHLVLGQFLDLRRHEEITDAVRTRFGTDKSG